MKIYKHTLLICIAMLGGCSTTQHVIVIPPDGLAEDSFRNTYSKCLAKAKLHSYLEDPHRSSWEDDIKRSDTLKDIWLGQDLYVEINHASNEWSFRVVATTRKDQLAEKGAGELKTCISVQQPSSIVSVESVSSVDLR